MLDRLVGYSLSPLLWDKVQRGLSAGRVQSVAVRLIVDREREIQAFVPVEYWSLHANLKAKLPAGVHRHPPRGRRREGGAGHAARRRRRVVDSLEGARFVVRSVTRGERKRNPAPPFITSTLQQDAGRKLGFSAKKTMTVAQQLYEGIDARGRGRRSASSPTCGRTPCGSRAEAQQEARQWAIERIGARVPAGDAARLQVARQRPGGPRGHPALRRRAAIPRSVASFLTKDQLALYRLIWERFMASQMSRPCTTPWRPTSRPATPCSAPRARP